jgi:hypothetical protein
VLGLALNTGIVLIRNRVLFWDPSLKSNSGQVGRGL